MRVDQRVDQGFPAGEWLLPGLLGQHWHLLSAPSNGVCHPEAAEVGEWFVSASHSPLLFTATRAHLLPAPQDTQAVLLPPVREAVGPGHP